MYGFFRTMIQPSVFIVLLLFAVSSPILALDLNLQSNPSVKSDKQYVELRVIDSYLELHSGPGRGYPIFHVIEQDDQVKVLTRRANWFYVSDRRGREGWVKQEGLARTLAPTGLPAALPETNHGDFLKQQGRVGLAFGKQEAADTVTVMGGYRLHPVVGIEAEYGQFFGKYNEGRFYGANLLIEPFQFFEYSQNWSFTPFLSWGLGEQRWQEKTKINVGTSSSSTIDYKFAGFGLHYYIGFNFVIRGEYRNLILTPDNLEVSNDVWRVGFSSFF